MVRHAVPNNAREGRRNLGDQLHHSSANPFDVALVYWYVLVLANAWQERLLFEEAFPLLAEYVSGTPVSA